MRNPITIGDKVFKYKKDALAYYKNILNSYKFGESLNDAHFDDLLDLLDYDDSFDEEDEIDDEDDIIENTTTPDKAEQDLAIKDIRVAKVQFNTKCFEIIYNDSTTCYISYLQIINRPKYNPDNCFYVACRNAIHNDIRVVKQKYFDANSNKGYVKCQETGQMSKWEDLAVDHRQPNTFSIIVDRFKEVKQIDTKEIDYVVSENNLLLFSDQNLTSEFVLYHKTKANLRIVRKENNLSRTGMARLKQTSVDLKIE